MALFVYQAVSKNGQRVSGEVEAQSRAEAFRKLDRDRLQPISLIQKEGGAANENVATKKETRGSTRSHRTESARGRNTSQRRAA